MVTVEKNARYEDDEVHAAAELEVAEQLEKARGEVQEQLERAEQIWQDPELQLEGIRQFNWSYAGLLGIGMVMVQPFLTADSLDVSAIVSVVAFSVAIPLLAALVMVSWQESFRGRMTSSRAVAAARPVAQLAALVGVVAGFWHIHRLAGAGLLVSTLVAVGVHSAGWTRLELSGELTPEEPVDAEEPVSPEPKAPAPRHADGPEDRAKGLGDTESSG